MDQEYEQWLDSQQHYYEMAGSFDSADNNKGENNE